MTTRIDTSLPATIRRDVSIAPMHTLGLNCRAWGVAEVVTLGELADVIAWANEHERPIRVLGGGSNVCPTMDVIDTLIVRLASSMFETRIDVARATMCCGAATLWPTAIRAASKASLGGLEYGLCIPGTLGGALAGNAGAGDPIFGKRDIAQDLLRVRVVDRAGQDGWLERNELSFQYRSSPLNDVIVVEAEFQLHPTTPTEHRDRVEAARGARKNQPTGVKSSGCFFRNPAGQHAGALIDQAGLKGHRIGDAQVSPVHANFLVNLGQATPSDMTALMAHVRETVHARTGIELEPEVRLI